MTSRKLQSIASTAFATFLFCAASLFAQTPSFVSFDAPGAGTGSFQGTIATCINSAGAIGGFYYDSSNKGHAFVRNPSGVITGFDVPQFSNPQVLAINTRGDVVGLGDNRQGFQAFLRTANGHVVQVGPPGAPNIDGIAINDSAQIAGYWGEVSGIWHSFIRQTDGTYTIFDEPDASLTTGKGTRAFAISNDGVVTGNYDDKNTGGIRGFIRDQFGNFTSFDVVSGGQVEIAPAAINSSGAITGVYTARFSGLQGFVRDASGSVSTFDIPDSIQTEPFAMNDTGTVVGQWINRQRANAGFTRDASGNLTRFSVPVTNFGAMPRAINNTGRIVGAYWDANSVYHGFVR